MQHHYTVCTSDTGDHIDVTSVSGAGLNLDSSLNSSDKECK